MTGKKNISASERLGELNQRLWVEQERLRVAGLGLAALQSLNEGLANGAYSITSDSMQAHGTAARFVAVGDEARAGEVSRVEILPGFTSYTLTLGRNVPQASPHSSSFRLEHEFRASDRSAFVGYSHSEWTTLSDGTSELRPDPYVDLGVSEVVTGLAELILAKSLESTKDSETTPQ